jgi:transcriptional regulator with XRE-family HTH domain
MKLKPGVVRALKLERRLSTKQLANLCGVEYWTVNRWMAGTQNPRPDEAYKLALALKVTLDELFLDPPPPIESPAVSRPNGLPEDTPKKFTLPPGTPIPEEYKEASITRKGDYLAVRGDDLDHLLDAIKARFSTTHNIYIVKLVPISSYQIDIYIHKDDYELLLLEYEMETLRVSYGPGKFSNLQITYFGPLLKPANPVRNAWWKSLWMPTILAVAGVACSLSGTIPIEAFPIYMLGLLLSAIASALRWKVAGSYLLPAIALAMNSAAAIAWPYTIGFFQTHEGITFKAAQRIRMGQVQVFLDDNFFPDQVYSLSMGVRGIGTDPPRDGNNQFRDPISVNELLIKQGKPIYPAYSFNFRGRISPIYSVEAGKYYVVLFNSGIPVSEGMWNQVKQVRIFPSVYGVNEIAIRAHSREQLEDFRTKTIEYEKRTGKKLRDPDP